MFRESNKTPDVESHEVPEAVLDYLKKLHKTIKNDYKTPEGSSPEHCYLIALEIAKLLLDSGKNPYILNIFEKSVEENGAIKTKSLEPKMFGGRVSWGAHKVCCCDGLAFDPLVGEPIPIDKYCPAVFGEKIENEVSKNPEQTKYEILADQLDELQKNENNRRGVSCVKQIIYYLRLGEIQNAKTIAITDHDKIRNYPKINEFIKNNLFTPDEKYF